MFVFDECDDTWYAGIAGEGDGFEHVSFGVDGEIFAMQVNDVYVEVGDVIVIVGVGDVGGWAEDCVWVVLAGVIENVVHCIVDVFEVVYIEAFAREFGFEVCRYEFEHVWVIDEDYG